MHNNVWYLQTTFLEALNSVHRFRVCDKMNYGETVQWSLHVEFYVHGIVLRLKTDGGAPRNIFFFCLCIWNYTHITNDWNIKHCGAAGRERSKLCETPICRYIYNLFLLILAINITVKFTIHLEHTRKASFFMPALVIWSRLNSSFQKICINPHRPYTVHKLWKGLFLFFSFTFSVIPKIQKDYLQWNIIYSFLRSFFIHQCLI